MLKLELQITQEQARKRREFVTEKTSTKLENIGKYSFDPSVTTGNIENFIGAAQVPIGVIGPPSSQTKIRLVVGL